MIDLKNVKEEDLQFRVSAPANISAKNDNGPRRFAGVGYSGEKITGHPYWGTVAFDLSGMEVPDPMPILLGHDPDKIVGFSQSHSRGNDGLKLEGVLSKTTEYGRQVEALSDEGFPWQMSVRIKPSVIEEVMPDAFAEVNGRTLAGPAYIFRKSKVSETSFTPIGWDDKTSATALSLTTSQQEEQMSKELEDRIKKLEEELKASNEKVAALEKDNQELKEGIAIYEQKELQASQNARLVKVKTLFSALGKEANEASMAPYISMDGATFDIVYANTLELSKKNPEGKKQELPEGLFSEQASSGSDTPPEKSFLELDAERRREEHLSRCGKKKK